MRSCLALLEIPLYTTIEMSVEISPVRVLVVHELVILLSRTLYNYKLLLLLLNASSSSTRSRTDFDVVSITVCSLQITLVKHTHTVTPST